MGFLCPFDARRSLARIASLVWVVLMNEIRPLRLLVKAVCLFIIANLIFALWNPPVGQLSLYNVVFPGRTRFPFGTGVVDSNITVDDLDAMFAAHVIAAPKQKDELRVIIIGDSSIWGTLLYADQTLAAQLNKLQLACSGKTLHFYNLGYPHPSVLQDLFILQKALQYQPDMVIWAITPNSLRPKPLNVFLSENIQPVQALINKYHLRYPYRDLISKPTTFFDRTLIGQRSQLSRLLLLQSLALPWTSTGLDIAPDNPYQKLSNNLQSSLAFGKLHPPASIKPFLLLDYLKTGVRMSAGIPVLFVNQPMFLPTGKNSDRRYNAMYPQWAYDQYRKILANQAAANGWHLADLWNVAPPEDFTDYELHLSPQGEQLMAQGMQASVQKTACP
jgi:hypothetical protein